MAEPGSPPRVILMFLCNNSLTTAGVQKTCLNGMCLMLSFKLPGIVRGQACSPVHYLSTGRVIVAYTAHAATFLPKSSMLKSKLLLSSIHRPPCL